MNKFADLTKEQFDALVQSEVDKHLSSRERADAQREAEEALKEAKELFESLKASIEAKDAKIKEYEQMLANLDLDPTAAEVAANEKVVSLESSLADWKRRAEVAEAALLTLARDEAAASRMAELEEVGVALDNEDAQAQYAKVREMSDDDFAAYKHELVALRGKFSSSVPDGAAEAEAETATLTAEEIKLIAQSLGCDANDAKCISLVQDVAKSMSEVSKSRKKKPPFPFQKKDDKNDGDEDDKDKASTDTNSPKKETASTKDTKLSLGEAITKAMDQSIQAPASLTEELSQAWTGYLAGKRGAKKE